MSRRITAPNRFRALHNVACSIRENAQTVAFLCDGGEAPDSFNADQAATEIMELNSRLQRIADTMRGRS